MMTTTDQVLHQFDTPNPIEVDVEFGKGNLRVIASVTGQTEIAISGRYAGDVDVTHHGDQITMIAPRQRERFVGNAAALDIRITLPPGSALASKTGSANTSVSGRIGAAHLRSGSGDVRAEHIDGLAQINTGSGAVNVERATHEIHVKSGSGRVTLGHTEAGAAVSTGSGDISIGESHGLVTTKTGSGDVILDQAHTDASMSTGSGDLKIRCAHQDRISLKSGSGDCEVGVLAGVPVWLDVASNSGRVDSDLAGAGEPDVDQPYVSLRVASASGNITLTQVAKP